ncbi:hypothetical protein [Methylobacterium fujisawaense]
MTLRTLKKRSKQALPILQKHYPQVLESLGPVFLAERGENYHGYVIRCTHGAGDVTDRMRRYCSCSYHPLPGTPMTGEVSGYYEPEWDERPVYQTLVEAVRWHDRPATMTDREWRRTLAITRTSPITEAEMAAEWGAEDESDREAA